MVRACMIVLRQEKVSAPLWLIFKINIGELLSGPVAHDEASVVEFFNRPWWWKTTSGGHGASRSAIF
jgi:hypothetical protein